MLVAGVSFQIAVLVEMIVKPASTLDTGETVLLRVVPVDPRDLFHGEYVILSYEFRMIPGDALPGISFDNEETRTVYVTLESEEDGRHWRAAGYSLERPQGVLYLEGHTTCWRRLEFGIESYFVQEGEGHKYEEAVRERKLSAEIAVDENGQAVLKRLGIE